MQMLDLITPRAGADTPVWLAADSEPGRRQVVTLISAFARPALRRSVKPRPNRLWIESESIVPVMGRTPEWWDRMDAKEHQMGL